jgi:hypothetical protein
MHSNSRMDRPTCANILPVAEIPRPAASADRLGVASSFVATLRNLPRPSLGLVLFLVGMQLMYFLPLLIPANRVEGAALGTYRYLFMVRMLVLAGAFLEAKAGGFWLLKRYPTWTAWGIVTLALTTSTSLIAGGGVLDVVAVQHAFVWLLLVPAMALRPGNWTWLLMTIACQAAFGSTHALYQIFVAHVSTRIGLLEENDTYQFVGAGLCMGSLLLMLLPSFREKWLKRIAIVAYVSMTIQSFFAAMRYPLLLVPAELLLVSYCAFRVARAHGGLFRWMMAGPPTLVFLFLAWVLVSSAFELQGTKSMFADGSEQLVYRMTAEGSFRSTLSENKRWAEVRACMTSMSWTDWLVGKGFVTAWDDPEGLYMDARFMVHNSFVNCFYWGGLPLFLMVMTPLVWAMKVLSRSDDPVAIGCAAFMLTVYLKFPAYLIYTDSTFWLLFCIATGRCAWNAALLSPATRCIPARGHPSPVRRLSPNGLMTLNERSA